MYCRHRLRTWGCKIVDYERFICELCFANDSFAVGKYICCERSDCDRKNIVMKRIGRKGLFVFGLMIVTGLVASGSFFSALLPNKKKTMRISNLTIVHILPLTWSRADKPPYSALISGFEHLLGINMEKTDFQRHFSIISP